MDEQLRVTDDVDEQDMPDLELHFRGSLGRRRIWIHRIDPSFGEEALATSGSPLYALRGLSSAKKFRRFTSYYLLGPICSGPESSCWKSGRLRMGSQTGSIFNQATDVPRPGFERKRGSLLRASLCAPIRASICASPIWKDGPSRASFSIEIKSAAFLETRRASALRPRAR